MTLSDQAVVEIEARVERFVREVVVPFERDPRCSPHGPADDLVQELRALARAKGVLTPHIRPEGHLSHRQTARLLIAAGLSPLGPVAVNVAAPDEGNMYLLSRVASSEQQRMFLEGLVSGQERSAFFMTEPADDQGAGSDPSMLKTTARRRGDDWFVNGRKAFITGAVGASTAIVMAMAEEGATLFLARLPDPAVRIDRVLDTIDSALPGGHSIVTLKDLVIPGDQVLGEVGRGFEYAQVRLAPARLTHCMRWLGAARRAQEIALDYACRRQAFGKPLVEHEGVGFMLAENAIALKQAELMVDWCAGVLDSGAKGTTESSMTKVAVSEGLYGVADRCVQIMGGTGVSRDTVVEQVFREIRAFRIYDGPTEVHKWSLARRLARSGTGRL